MPTFSEISFTVRTTTFVTLQALMFKIGERSRIVEAVCSFLFLGMCDGFPGRRRLRRGGFAEDGVVNKCDLPKPEPGLPSSVDVL
jgi:hypothetical protein